MNTGNFGHDRMKLHIVQNKILEANEYQHEQKCSRIKAAKTLKKNAYVLKTDLYGNKV